MAELGTLAMTALRAMLALAALAALALGSETCTAEGAWCPQLELSSVNQRVIDAQYAVRGPLLLRALEIEQELRDGSAAYPFERVVKCNIGNPQALGQRPITFTRQVLALTMHPGLLDEPASRAAFPEDAVRRAEAYLAQVRSVGAYSESQGVELVRQEVADFITLRDGVAARKEDVFLSAGASQAVQQLLTLLLRDAEDAVLVPIPQYPLYSALTKVLGGHMAGYLMGEATGWTLDMGEVRRALGAARAAGKQVRALVVINPGNPTGSSLPRDAQEAIVRFCAEENIVLLADEVYQTNVYGERPFESFRRIAHGLGMIDASGKMHGLQLASFHSVSKGVVGECGLRGGYAEYLGFDKAVVEQIYKLASIGLCSNVPGQLAVGLMVNPPRPGDPSFALYEEERSSIFVSLKRRAAKLEAALNALPGVTCNPIEGAMYAFPRVELPARFVAEAEAAGTAPDAAYALQLLEQTGLVVVPGAGFGQRDGTFHVRTTFLPPEEVMDDVLERFASFHKSLMARYGGKSAEA